MKLRYWLAALSLSLASCLDPNPSAATEQDNPWVPYTPLAENSAIGDTPPEPGAPSANDCAKTPMSDWGCLKLPPDLPPMAAKWSGPTKGYATLCARCHGIDGKGVEQGKKLGAKDLSSEDVQKLTNEQLAAAIKAGSKNQKMPAFGEALSDALINDLVGHVRELPNKKFKPLAP
jgi:cytochrome c553